MHGQRNQGLHKLSVLIDYGFQAVYVTSVCDDFSNMVLTTTWVTHGENRKKTYLVQTSSKVIQRCLLMTTDPATWSRPDVWPMDAGVGRELG